MDGQYLYLTNGDVAYIAIPIDKSSVEMYYFPRGLKRRYDDYYPYYPSPLSASYELYLYDTEWYKVEEVLNAGSSSASKIKYFLGLLSIVLVGIIAHVLL